MLPHACSTQNLHRQTIQPRRAKPFQRRIATTNDSANLRTRFVALLYLILTVITPLLIIGLVLALELLTFNWAKVVAATVKWTTEWMCPKSKNEWSANIINISLALLKFEPSKQSYKRAMFTHPSPLPFLMNTTPALANVGIFYTFLHPSSSPSFDISYTCVHLGLYNCNK